MEQATEDGQNRILRDEYGKFREGTASPNPSGKPKGVKDRANEVRLAFFEAFEKTGGISALVEWVKKSSLNRREFYKMLLPLLPKDFNIENEAIRDRAIIVHFGSPEMKTIIVNSEPKTITEQ